MMRWIVGVGAGLLLTVAGLIIILGNVEWVMRLAGLATQLPRVRRAAMQSGLGSPSHVYSVPPSSS